MATGNLPWPVCGRHPNIDYLIAEYWSQWPGGTPLDAYKRSGSSDQVMEVIKKNLHALVEKTHPMCDEFHILCACDMIRRWKPDLMMVHLANLDDYRHENGVFNRRVTEGIREGTVLESGRLEDQAPTYAKLLGIPFPECDGRPLCQILRE